MVQLLHAVCRNKKTFGSMIIACFTTIWICSSSWFKITAMTVERSWTECVPCWHILFMIGVFLLQCCQVSLSAGHTGSCQISRLSFEAEFGLWVQCMCWRLPQRGNFFRTTEFFFFFFTSKVDPPWTLPQCLYYRYHSDVLLLGKQQYD